MSGVWGRDDNMDKIRIAAKKRDICAEFNVYIDGSASGGILDRGVGVVVTRETPNGCATKLFSGSFYGLPISMCRSAWKVYRLRPPQIQS